MPVGRSGINRAWLNYGIDVLLLLTGATLAVSSLLIWVVLPKGYHPAWLRWIAVHKWSGFALLVEASLHVSLHWRWLARMTRRLFTKR
jgi:hypothetical protein